MIPPRNQTSRPTGLTALPPRAWRGLRAVCPRVLRMAAFAHLLACAAYAASGPRQEVKFDANWLFHLGDVEGIPGFSNTSWRTVDLPHDWSIEDLPAEQVAKQAPLAIVPGAWRFSFGDDMAWKEAGFNDSSWQQVRLPAKWSAHAGKSPPNSFGWYRRRIDIPADLRGKDIMLLIGKVDDVDETFVNGVKVGGMGTLPPHYATAWTVPRRYPVPAKLLKGDGTDVVAVRVYNGDADAGIYESAGPSQRSGPFDAASPAGTAQGYTLGGIGWYLKRFTLSRSFEGKHVDIMFDGVYMNSQVWLNGVSLGTRPYGYTSFQYDLTPHLKSGQRNDLLVKVDASGLTSRWYSGAGIFRHVRLVASDPVHVVPWGVYVTTPETGADKATVRVRTTVANAAQAGVTVHITDAAGKTLASGESTRGTSADGQCEFDQSLVVPKPCLWSCESPVLYQAVSTLRVAGKVVDEVKTPFGIRAITIDSTRGFTLNGKSIKLRGGCVHHDNGFLGSATYDRAEERRVELLKAAGFNAIRTSHNPPSPAFLDACDRLGMIVMDESFDCWAHGKNHNDYGGFFNDWWKRDIDSMVLRDRNHPSIAIWSIGNEIPEQNSGAEAAQRGAMLADEVRRLDPTRPVTQACNPDKDKLEPLLQHEDVTSYNYAHGRFADDFKKHPGRVFAQTESFPQDSFGSWMTVTDHPYVLGDFVWTALDYLGEAGLGKTVPQSTPPGYADGRLWTVSNCGDLDFCGAMRPQCYYRNVLWGTGPKVSAFVEALGPDGKPQHVKGWGWRDERPSWTWPGLEGKPVTVRVYASCPQVRLTFQGIDQACHDLGTKPTNRDTKYTATWEIPYQSGELLVIGLDDQGKEAGRCFLCTAGKPASIRLTPDRTTLAADGQDLSYVTVELLDAKGVLCPNASDLVNFQLTGEGKIAAVGNSDPRSVESFQQPRRKAFCGRCMVVVRAGKEPGRTTLSASADGLPGSRVDIKWR